MKSRTRLARAEPAVRPPRPAVLALAALLPAACRGGEGSMGPAGPRGAEGAVGPQGPGGTANVIAGRDAITEADGSSTTVQWGFSSPSIGTVCSAPVRYCPSASPRRR